MCCATPLPLICWKAAQTCARCRRCWAMPTSRRPKSTPMCRRRRWSNSSLRRIHEGRERGKERKEKREGERCGREKNKGGRGRGEGRKGEKTERRGAGREKRRRGEEEKVELQAIRRIA